LKAPPMPRLAPQLVRFIVVGGIGFIADAGLVFLLTRLGMSPIAARIPSIATAILLTWYLNRRLTFKVAHASSAGELVRYSGVALVSACLNFAVYTALVLGGVIPEVAVAVATIALMAVNFFGYKLFAFRRR